MNAIAKLFNYIHIFLVAFAKILLLVMILLVSTQVFLRYVFNTGIRWAEEVSMLTMLWFSFISLSIGVKEKLHICIEIFTNYLPDKFKKVISKLTDIVILFFGVIMVVYGVKLAEYTMASTLPATGLPAAVSYMIVPISGLLVVYYSFTDLFNFNKTDVTLEKIAEGGK